MISMLPPFRILVTGTRQTLTAAQEWTIRTALVNAAAPAHDRPVIVVRGDCPTGVDALMAEWWPPGTPTAETWVADWSGPCDAACYHGARRSTSSGRGTTCPAAGPRRNQQMVDAGADVCLAFPLGKSSGTRHCAAAAKRAGIPTTIIDLT